MTNYVIQKPETGQKSPMVTLTSGSGSGSGLWEFKQN